MRLRRTSWKSKNNVYYTDISDLDSIIEEIWKIDILIVSDRYSLENTNFDGELVELQIPRDVSEKDAQDWRDNIQKIDEKKLSLFAWGAAFYATELEGKYYWKNIVILEK